MPVQKIAEFVRPTVFGDIRYLASKKRGVGHLLDNV